MLLEGIMKRVESNIVRFIMRTLLLGLYGLHYWHMFDIIANCPEREKVFKDHKRYGGRWRYLTALNEVGTIQYTGETQTMSYSTFA